MKRSIGFPYHYGDEGPENTVSPNAKVIRIALFAGILAGLIVNPAFAVDEAVVLVGGKLYKKVALEAARSGACLVLASQSAKCGNMPAATAFLCVVAIFTCIDATAKIASATHS